MVAVILALFIRTFVVQAFKIPTGSMETNLLIGDHLLVNKLVYSPSLGPARGRPASARRPIHRGHVVVFKFPEDPTRDFIKRVIGLPGRDGRRSSDKQVLVDGKPLVEPYAHFIEAAAPARRPRVRPARRVDPRQLGPAGGARGAAASSWATTATTAATAGSGASCPDDQVKGRALLVYWSYEATREEYHRTGYVEWVK